MRYVAAYLLAALAGNQSPDASTIEKILNSVGVKVEQANLSKVINELQGKSIEDLIKEGTSKLASVPAAPTGATASASVAASSGAPASKKEEPKKEEKKEESEDEDMGFGLFD